MAFVRGSRGGVAVSRSVSHAAQLRAPTPHGGGGAVATPRAGARRSSTPRRRTAPQQKSKAIGDQPDGSGGVRPRPREERSSSDQGVTILDTPGPEFDRSTFKAQNTTSRFVHVVLKVFGDNVANNKPKQKLLAPFQSTVVLGEVWRDDPGRDWNHKWTWTMTFDDPEAVHDDSVVYSFPFDETRALYCCQGFDGAFSHQGPLRYSVDWKATPGTRVLAARGGVVTRIRQDSKESGPLELYVTKTNLVSITHPDHTVGEYLHLQYKGAAVKLGDQVSTGQLIGYSGNSGWSTIPHIHFHVYRALLYDPAKPEGPKFETIPVKYSGSGWVPTEGEWCPQCSVAVVPDKEYKSNGIVISEYSRGTAALELRVVNENRTHAKLHVDITGENIGVSRPLPVLDVVPAGAERFVVRIEQTLQSAASKIPWKWSFKFRFDHLRAAELGCKDDRHLQQIARTFEEMEANANGCIEKNEYWQWLRTAFGDEVVTKKEVDLLWAGMDMDREGTLGFIHWVRAMLAGRHKPGVRCERRASGRLCLSAKDRSQTVGALADVGSERHGAGSGGAKQLDRSASGGVGRRKLSRPIARAPRVCRQLSTPNFKPSCRTSSGGLADHRTGDV